MIAAPSSGSGKTTLTMGLARALKSRGLDVSCLKTGPDYIDTAFLSRASGREAGNLDLHLQGLEGTRQAFSLAGGNFCVVEGAMGYFDGLRNTWKGSSFDIAKRLGINTVLVYSPRGEMFSAIVGIRGMVDFSGGLISAVIFNRVSAGTYALLKEALEKHTGTRAIGFLPAAEGMELKSRHLGLVQSVEVKGLDRQIDLAAQNVSENIDIDALLELAGEVEGTPFPRLRSRNITVAVARDRAFSFYYRENLKLLENACRVEYFSPLADSRLPRCDLVYLGGGYPEVFREELAANRQMLAEIRGFAEKGGCIYAECGGMLYLSEKVEGTEMASVFSGECRLTGRLQRFGYIDITLREDCMLGRAGTRLTAHEFHRSVCSIGGKEIFDINKTMGTGTWACGYRYKNVLAGYPHINFLGNTGALESLLDYVETRACCK